VTIPPRRVIPCSTCQPRPVFLCAPMSAEKANHPSSSVATKRARKTVRKKTARSIPEKAAAESAETAAESAAAADQPAPSAVVPETATVGAEIAAESPRKNKRRRRKGKGGKGEDGETSPAATTQPAAEASAPTGMVSPPRSRVDAELLAKFAWKIYLAEISEEGVALIGDHDARELSRRCFRLAEIFLDEQSRRR